MKEFCLSDKAETSESMMGKGMKVKYPEKDVKEFIKLLREEIGLDRFRINKIINELAGEKLI